MQSSLFILNRPTFLIEFDNAGGLRRNGNHIHTIWREKGNEFGEDVFGETLQRGETLMKVGSYLNSLSSNAWESGRET